jgi:PERQ amino acid-rich with GYF domain-containing protein
MMHEEDDIADTIYQSSPTLPGKRFAAEFMEKRRSDRGLGGPGATAAARNAATSAGSGAESWAGRLQPGASASQDAFGFKVVKKKGKGGKP